MTLGRFLSIPNARPERLNVASNPLYETGLDSIFPVRGLHDSLGTQMLGTGGEHCLEHMEAMSGHHQPMNLQLWCGVACVTVTPVCSIEIVCHLLHIERFNFLFEEKI